MKKIALIASIFIGVGFASAQAADLPRAPVKAPVMAPLPTWNGLYVGVHGGWGWGDADHLFSPVDPLFGTFPPNGAASHDIDGGILGLHMGYNWQFAPNWLIGLEASIAWTGMDGTTPALPSAPGFSVNADIDWLVTATPRLGWTNNNWLFYVKGGFAGARVETNSINPTPTTFNSKNSFIGWTAGVGVEVMWSPNWIFGLEYNYYDLGSESIGGVYLPVIAPAGRTTDLKFSSVLARLSYKY